MKKLTTVIILCFLAMGISQAQSQFVKVKYQMSVDMDAEKVVNQMPAQARAAYGDMIRQEINNGIFIDYNLQTNGKESIYKMEPKVDNGQNGDGFIAQQIMSFDKGDLYKDLSTNFYMKPVDFPGMSYMIKDQLPDMKWNISREKDQIAGFDVVKATGVLNDTIPVTAWFTKTISIKDGPASFWGLPGLIIKAQFEMNGADMTLVAKDVEVREEEIAIKKPSSSGKEVTQKEFEQIVLDLQKQYQELSGGGVDKD